MAVPTADTQTNVPTDTTPPVWTYPTRFCRICREDVPATVTMYPPGLPVYLQRPIVEYVNEDEYGRLIKPCMCRGGMRYIHELCLRRSRTENNRVGSMWKCHECGHKFNFSKLALQRWLGGKIASGLLTILLMIFMMFALGFVADPILRLHDGSYDTLMRQEQVWNTVRRKKPLGKGAVWTQHFAKGFISMGLVGCLKIWLASPTTWWSLRQASYMTSRSTSVTGRDRTTMNWLLVVLIGVSFAFYFFYKWVQAIVQKLLQRIGNNIVNTQLPGDDDDLKPPPGWKPHEAYGDKSMPTDSQTDPADPKVERTGKDGQQSGSEPVKQNLRYRARQRDDTAADGPIDDSEMEGNTSTRTQVSADSRIVEDDTNSNSDSSSGSGHLGNSSVLQDSISQGWSFADLDASRKESTFENQRE